MIILSFELLKLAVTILTWKSAVPTANMFELGWKERVIMGDVEIGFLDLWLRVLTVQHWDSRLKNPKAMVLQVEPRANFLALGAHLDTKIDNLISILTSCLYHLNSEVSDCFQMKTLRSWLQVINLLSTAQSTSLTVCVWSLIFWMSSHESISLALTTLNILTVWSFLVAMAQKSFRDEKLMAVMWFYWRKSELDGESFINIDLL